MTPRGRVHSRRELELRVEGGSRVSAVLLEPRGLRTLCVLAHGAGSGMRHPFLENVAEGLAERAVASLRYQFPYMEEGRRRPDPPRVAQATVRAAVEAANRAFPRAALVAGGKSFGGRMTSQACADAPLAGVRGLFFLGFPLHPPGREGDERAEHLFRLDVPMLFLQGDRDALADLTLLRTVCRRLGGRATLHVIEQADHSFRLPRSAPRHSAEVMDELSRVLADWAGAL